jgi:hypothetical protein
MGSRDEEEAVTLDAARIAKSRAGERLGRDTKAVWAAEAVLAQAVTDGDPYAIGRAEAELAADAARRDRSEREYAAAESALVALAEMGEY